MVPRERSLSYCKIPLLNGACDTVNFNHIEFAHNQRICDLIDGDRQHDLQLQLGSERQVLDVHQHWSLPAENIRVVRNNKIVSFNHFAIRRLSKKDNFLEIFLFVEVIIVSLQIIRM